MSNNEQNEAALVAKNHEINQLKQVWFIRLKIFDEVAFCV